MKYNPPVGGAANDPYITGDPAQGIEGSAIPGEAVEVPQREIVNVITTAGLTPDAANNTQLASAIQSLIAAALSGVSKDKIIIENATFEASVTDGKPVYFDGPNSRFDEAVADGTTLNQAIGIADVTNAQVIAFGETPAGLLSGMTPGAKQYLDATTPGAITETIPVDIVKIGIAKSATVLYVDIDALANAGGVLQSVKVFTASGTWNKDAGTTKIEVEVKAGGGGGGGGYPDYHVGAGGGEGGKSSKIIDVSAVSSVAVTVGTGGLGGLGADAAGAGATNGSAGGSSSFGAYLSATGGEGAIRSGSGDSGWPVSGGIGSGGDLNLRGASSQQANRDLVSDNASGSGAGEGGGKGVYGTAVTGTTGLNGGGGAGGSYGASGAGGNGGVGGAGYIIIREYK